MADSKTTSSQSIPMEIDVNDSILYNNITDPSNQIQKDTETKITVNNNETLNNKLKRKKKISSSLISINNDDSINTEKKTKIESLVNIKEIILEDKPPLPPRKKQTQSPRIKKQIEDNNFVIHKLNAQNEQLRMEITELKVSLSNEKNAIRALRAQNECSNRKFKADVKKLQTALEQTKKSNMGNISKKQNAKDDNHLKDVNSNSELMKLNHEILTLKNVNKTLEDKIQKLNDNDKKRNSRTVHDITEKYEAKLTQLTKSAKVEICRLLEEIKAKERNIGLLKKEVICLKNNSKNNLNINNNNSKKRDMKVSQHPTEMKKLKDIVEATENSGSSITETNNNNNNNKKCNISNSSTCGEKVFENIPHELKDRILEVHDLHIYRVNDPVISDSDSALSSAPQSISPQPPSSDVTADIWQTVKNYTKELESIQQENTLLQNENENLKKELQLSKNQINDLEKIVLENDNKMAKLQQISDRVKYLEQNESLLLKEIHELKEQNELLEFRILEFDESNDKWSFQSNSSIDPKAMWADHEDDMLLYTDQCSDSGIISPHNNYSDDRNTISPCDFGIFESDDIKRRITNLSKRSVIDKDDKACLIQIVNLLNNLEAISNSNSISNDLSSLEMVKSKNSSCNLSQRSLSLPTPVTSITEKILNKVNNNRIVATVLPYSSSLSTPTDSPSRKLRSWTSSSLQESGVFEGDSFEQLSTQSTQTEPEDLIQCNENLVTNDLCAEIQKLNKFREQIEECVTKSTGTRKSTNNKKASPILSPNLSDQKRIQYYKDRLELLEKKIIVYESSGDVQEKHLAERLQREVQLESLVKELQEKVDTLEAKNLGLEEEKCEFEEAENDTRLRLQRLEVDLEILSQRNLELEMSREQLQGKLKNSRNQCNLLQNEIEDNKDKIVALEDKENNLKTRLNLIKASMPAILLFNTFMVGGGSFNLFNSLSMRRDSVPKVTNTEDLNLSHRMNQARNQEMDLSHRSNQTTSSVTPCSLNNARFRCRCQEKGPDIQATLQRELQTLMAREKDLVNNISELNRAYQETMENADTLWEQIEKDYKEKLLQAENNEYCYKVKINQLEERLKCDAHAAQERISQLEEIELESNGRYNTLHKEHRELTREHNIIVEDYHLVKEELNKIKKFNEGPGKEALELERSRIRNLQQELKCINKMLVDMERIHLEDIDHTERELSKVRNELSHVEVTNSELKEEVSTLEKEIIQLEEQKRLGDEKVSCLLDEIRTKAELIITLENQIEALEKTNYRTDNATSLAQELTNESFKNIDGIDNLRTASNKLGKAIGSLKVCNSCNPKSDEFQNIALEVKTIADKILHEQVSTNLDLKTFALPPFEKEDEYKDVLESPVNYFDKIVNFAFIQTPVVKYDLFPDEDLFKTEKVDNDLQAISEVPLELRELNYSKNLEIVHLENNLDIPPEDINNDKYHSAPSSDQSINTDDVRNFLTIKHPVVHEYTSPKLDIHKYSTDQSIGTDDLTKFLSIKHPIVHEFSTSKINLSKSSTSYLAINNMSTMKIQNLNVPSVNSKEIFINDERDGSVKNESSTILHTKFSNIVEEFIDTICNAINDSNKTSEKRLRELLKENREFEYILEQTVKNCRTSSNIKDDNKISEVLDTLNSYEDMLQCIKCLRIVQDIFRPIDIEIMKTIEERISNKLIEHHCNSINSKVFCKIYRPISREINTKKKE